MRIRTPILLAMAAGILTSTVLLGGCGEQEKKQASSPLISSSSVPSSTISVVFSRKDIKEIENFNDLPFSISYTTDTDSTGQPLDCILLPEYWKNAVFDTIGYRQALINQYKTKNSNPPTVPTGSVVRFSFDGYTPSKVTVKQDPNTGIPEGEGQIDESLISTVSHTAESDGSYTFPIEYEPLLPTAKYKFPQMLYYEITCEWESGDVLHYAFSISKDSRSTQSPSTTNADSSTLS